ncbi:MAG: signal peptidase II [Bacteriovoracaceae bacterium]
MKKWRMLRAFAPFFICWTLDYVIKILVSENFNPIHFNPIHIVYHENHGIILGGLSHLPLMLKTVFLCTLGISIVASFPVILNLVHFRSRVTVTGLSLLFSGILGNVTDRIIYGYVVDYIFLGTSDFTTPVFNLADAVQWVGYILIAKGIYRELNYHYPDNDRRKAKWVNRAYQLRFAFTLLSIVLGFGITFLGFGYTFLKYSLIEMNLPENEISYYLKFYVITSSGILFFASLMTLLIGKIISHRIAGPAHAIKRYINDTLLGKKYALKFRDGDHLIELEAPLTELNDKLAKKVELTLIKNDEDEPPPFENAA